MAWHLLGLGQELEDACLAWLIILGIAHIIDITVSGALAKLATGTGIGLNVQAVFTFAGVTRMVSLFHSY